MKKSLALVLSLLMVFATLPAMMSASAATKTINLTSDQITVGATQPVTSKVAPENSDYLWSISRTSVISGDQAYYIVLPASIWEKDVTGIKIMLHGDAAWSTNAGQTFFTNKLISSNWTNPTATSTLVTTGTYKSITTTPKTFVNVDLTQSSYSNIKNNKLCYFYLSNKYKTTNLMKVLYVDSITITYNETVTQYDVTVDGVATKYDEGSEFTFDKITTDGTNYYMPGEKVTVNSDLTFTTYDLGLAMSQGAAMRYETVSGMRYYTNVNTTVVDTLKAAGATLSFGTLIAPKNLIGDNDLTLDVADDNRLDVKYEASVWYTDDEFTGIVGTIAEVKDSNAKRDFVGRGYVTVELGGKTATLYADYYGKDVVNNTRQIGWIANEIKAGAEYDGLSAAQKVIVDKYYNLYII